MALAEISTGVAPYSDYEKAYEYAKDLKDCGEDCKTGTKWSEVFIGNAAILLMVTINMCCVCVGAYKPLVRLLAGVCAICTCCAQFGMVIASLVYRLNGMGQLCALSNYATNIPTTDPAEVNDDLTYSSDGTIILALVIVQLLASCGGAFIGLYPLRIPKVG